MNVRSLLIHETTVRRHLNHTGLHDGISGQEVSIDNITAADDLAVGRASGLWVVRWSS